MDAAGGPGAQREGLRLRGAREMGTGAEGASGLSEEGELHVGTGTRWGSVNTVRPAVASLGLPRSWLMELHAMLSSRTAAGETAPASVEAEAFELCEGGRAEFVPRRQAAFTAREAVPLLAGR